MIITDTCEAVLAPLIGTGARMVMREIIPGAAVLAVIFTNGSPLPLAQIRSPPFPWLSASGLFESIVLGLSCHGFLLPPWIRILQPESEAQRKSRFPRASPVIALTKMVGLKLLVKPRVYHYSKGSKEIFACTVTQCKGKYRLTGLCYEHKVRVNTDFHTR